MTTKKEIALDFLKLAARGDSREAFKLYVAKVFKHHNAYFKGDAETLMLAMEEAANTHPNKLFEPQHALEDGDLVVVHSRIVQYPAEKEYAVAHIFRFEGNKIIELWDFGQEVPDEKINENGMF